MHNGQPSGQRMRFPVDLLRSSAVFLDGDDVQRLSVDGRDPPAIQFEPGGRFGLTPSRPGEVPMEGCPKAGWMDGWERGREREEA